MNVKSLCIVSPRCGGLQAFKLFHHQHTFLSMVSATLRPLTELDSVYPQQVFV